MASEFFIISRPRLLLLSCALLLLLGLLAGKAQKTTTVDAAASTAAAAPETEQETIAKCLRDLASDDVKRRRRAVLVIGKYRAPQVIAALIGALEDADDQVRQSALVSLTEEGHAAPQAFLPILNLIQDPNVHIRRIASSLLQSMAPQLNAVLRDGPPQQLTELITGALQDSDAIVRKNVLAMAPFMSDWLSHETLIDNLQHEDREVRLLALQAYRRTQRNVQSFVKDLAPLIADQDPIVRAEAVAVLSQAGNDAVPLLLQLTEDEDLEVRLRAIRQLVQLQHAKAAEYLRSILLNEALPAAKRRSLLGYVLMLEEDESVAILKHIIENSPASMKAQALQVLSPAAADTLPLSFFFNLLEVPSQPVRRAVGNILTRRNNELEMKDIRALLAHPAGDVRLLALNLCLARPLEEVTNVIVEALLDEDLETRARAIEIAALKAIRDWPLFLQQSLQDPSNRIREAAVNALLRRKDQQSQTILMQYLAAAKASDAPEERLLALTVVEQLNLQTEEARSIIQTAIKDPNERVRQKAIQLTSRLPGQNVEMLRELMESDNAAIRIQAIRQLAQQRDPELLPYLKNTIASETATVQDKVMLMQFLQFFPEQVAELLIGLSKAPPPALQATAIRSLARLNQHAPPVDFFLQMTDHAEPMVQQAVAHALLLQRNKLTPLQIQQLFYASDSVDLQRTALQAISRLPPDEQRKMIVQAVQAEDLALKSLGLRMAAMNNIDGWRKILVEALDDVNVEVQKAAAGGLLIRAHHDVAAREILAAYQKRCPDPRYAQLLKQRLEALQ